MTTEREFFRRRAIKGTNQSLRSPADRYSPLFSLAGPGHVHHPTVLVPRQVESLLALDAMERQVVLVACLRHDMQGVCLLRAPEPAPGAVAQVEHAVFVRHPVE